MGRVVRLRKLAKPARTKRWRRGTARRLWRWSGFIGLALLIGGIALFEDLGKRDAVPKPAFRLCTHKPYANCVIDGDTFYLGRQSIRVADIDAPETHPSRCRYEADLGTKATHRLLALLNAGPFTLETTGDRDFDKYGRALRLIVRDHRSLGDVLVAEGLARRWTGHRKPWCP